ncbi:MAG: hypothetical protein QW176_01205 [Candidatus Bathyarchaeia archaeon]
MLVEAWDLIEKYHLYQVNALQVVSAKAVNATQFSTGDKRVHEVARAEGLNSLLA